MLEVLLVLKECILLILLLTNVLIILIIIILFLHYISRIVEVLVLKLLGRRRFVAVLSSEIVLVLIDRLLLNVCLRFNKLFLLCLLTWKFSQGESLLLARLVLKLVFKIVGRLVLVGMSLGHVALALVVSVAEIALLLKIILLFIRMGPVIISKLRIILLLGNVVIILILAIRIICVAVGSIWTSNHAYVIGLKWLEFFIFSSIALSSTVWYYNRLIHEHILVFYLIIKTFYVLQIINLTSKKSQVICKHFPIQLFTHILFFFIFFIFLLSSIINIAIKKNKLMPVFQILLHMLRILLSNFKKVFSTW